MALDFYVNNGFDDSPVLGLEGVNESEFQFSPKIKIVGVGGGGGNAVKRMVSSSMFSNADVEYIAINTDYAALKSTGAKTKICIYTKDGRKGLGAGANPDVGREAAIYFSELIKEQLAGADLVIIVAGMGGGTGTGAAPIIAKVAKDIGALTIAIVTKPYEFEGEARRMVAENGANELRRAADTMLIIDNANQSKIKKGITVVEGWEEADRVVIDAVRCMVNILSKTAIINVDFADLYAFTANTGVAYIGSATANGSNTFQEAAKLAISSPLLENSIIGARKFIIYIELGSKVELEDAKEVVQFIRQQTHPNADFKLGVDSDSEMNDKMKVTVIATGMTAEPAKVEPPKADSISPSQITNSPRINNGTNATGVSIPSPNANATTAKYNDDSSFADLLNILLKKDK